MQIWWKNEICLFKICFKQWLRFQFINFGFELKDSDFNKPVSKFASISGNDIKIIVFDSINKKELESLKIN